MRKMKVPAYFGPLFLSMCIATVFLVPIAYTQTEAATAQSSSAQSATFFISCSTSQDGGIDTYYTAVSEIGAKPGPMPHTPMTLASSVDGGKTWMYPAVLSQSVLDHFQAYLTQKGYKFKPGSSSACDVKPTEAATKAAQHKRAYEGGGCSSCGKVVETGWKYTP
jgi:hypothetical protein